jgi:hypothetical protein
MQTAIAPRITELTAGLAIAAAAILLAMPVQGQSFPERELDLAQAERFGLTLPSPKGLASEQDIEQAKAKRSAELQRTRASGERPAYRPEVMAHAAAAVQQRHRSLRC